MLFEYSFCSYKIWGCLCREHAPLKLLWHQSLYNPHNRWFRRRAWPLKILHIFPVVAFLFGFYSVTLHVCFHRGRFVRTPSVVSKANQMPKTSRGICHRLAAAMRPFALATLCSVLSTLQTVAGKIWRFASLCHKVAHYGAHCSAHCGARCGAHYGPRVGPLWAKPQPERFFRGVVFTQSFTGENGPLQPLAGGFAGTITVTPNQPHWWPLLVHFGSIAEESSRV